MAKIKVDPKLAARILTEFSKNPMGGWFNLPYTYGKTDENGKDPLERLKMVAEKIRSEAKYLVCIGIGGSYLGHRAVIEAIQPKSETKILYAGNSLSSIEINNVINEIGEDDFSVLVISKSGTTRETAIAFRIFKEKLIEKYGIKEAKNRIYAITDEKSGALHDEAIANKYLRISFPDNLGGRYSVLSVVGILPMLVAGVNVEKLLQGARECREKQLVPEKLEQSALVNYAFTRHMLYQSGVKIEVLASFEPRMMYFNEWWKQLFGESEGKNEGGLFPASVIYSTDLHSMGQYMQEGQRCLLETFIKFGTPENPSDRILVPEIKNISEPNPEKPDEPFQLLTLDNLDALAGRPVDFVNDKALEATVIAHDKGGISTIVIEVFDNEDKRFITERSIGYLLYFFEVACAMSARLNKVDPFDQPGVEAYKKELKKLLSGPQESEKK